MPLKSTITAILRRHGLIDPSESAKGTNPPRFEHEAPNDLWQMDKGHIPMSGGRRCYPLTVLDDHARFSLGVRACRDEKGPTVQDHLTSNLRHYNMPYAILVDNGSPWGQRSGSPLHPVDCLDDPVGHQGDPQQVLPHPDPGKARALPQVSRGRAAPGEHLHRHRPLRTDGGTSTICSVLIMPRNSTLLPFCTPFAPGPSHRRCRSSSTAATTKYALWMSTTEYPSSAGTSVSAGSSGQTGRPEAYIHRWDLDRLLHPTNRYHRPESMERVTHVSEQLLLISPVCTLMEGAWLDAHRGVPGLIHQIASLVTLRGPHFRRANRFPCG